MPIKWSEGTGNDFPKLKIKVRAELVAFGNPDEITIKDFADEIIHTETFDVPFLPTANMGQSTSPATLREDFALDDLIFDPTQYLSYSN